MSVSREGSALLRLASAALGTSRLPTPVAVRTAAVLGRQSLEAVVRDRLRTALPGAEQGSFRAQLLCLSYLDGPVGRRASHLFGTFSRICHHQGYEVTPTPDEIRELLDQIAQLCEPAGTDA